MLYRNRRSAYCNFILIFVAIKVVLNLLAISNFGFHRDELLHLALGDHLAWGYKEVPPFIGLLAKISSIVFGDTVFASRILSTIASGFIVWLTGLITLELGGRRFAIAMACLSMIFAPAFAATGYLFQPVVFDQLWWVLMVWLIIKYINSSSPAYIYAVGVVIGVGMLTKYTMGFFALSIIAGLLISKQRKLLFNKHVLGAALVALLIFLPNIIWQWQHHFPVIGHMKELRDTQLEFVEAGDFIAQQFLANGISLVVWLTGFIALLFAFKLRKFQFLAIGYILIFLFLLEMNGKSYYLFGAYPMLFAAGGFAFDRILKTWGKPLRAAVILLLTLPNVILLPIVLPVLPLKQTLAFFDYSSKNLGFKFLTTWEDQKQHATSQDYADMLGWNEIAALVATAYNDLAPEDKPFARILADNYGQAGAIQVLGKQYKLPEVVCLNSSFSLWAPDSLNARFIIYIAETAEDIAFLSKLVEKHYHIGTVKNPLAREVGTGVYLLVNPTPGLEHLYHQELAKKRAQ